MSSFGRRTVPATVRLNVYDLAPVNDALFPLGLGLYHTGVEISSTSTADEEYTFADTAGVFAHPPRAVPDHARWRMQLDLGTCDPALVSRSVAALRDGDKFGPPNNNNTYHLLHNNCNHFAQALVWLLVQRPIPAWINRMATIGACCSCLIPKQLLTGGSNNNNKQNGADSSSSPFLVKAPANRIHNRASNNGNSTVGSATTNTTTTTAGIFQGRGSILGGGHSVDSSGGGGGASMSGADATLTDRREKARMAALARLERQQPSQNQPSHDGT